ncbi:MAG: 2,3-bisphosphoglycerate-independent phosphoglycerate mutase [Deltaproteobacteria bacterium]|nr:2,3-bisphosphoglycerate-independent phosphoglycerate mutase [Deltaproteobacteria bacterium]
MTDPIVLVILDGFGEREAGEGNSILRAKTPNLRKFLENYPHTLLEASGEAVGLPKGTMGNSEVGHLTIGAGRIICQDLSRIHHAIDEGSFFKNPTLLAAFRRAVKKRKRAHLIGLLSDGGVHSHERHLFSLFKMAREQKTEKLSVHCFLDGRDTPPKSSQIYLARLQEEMKREKVGEIATLIGRYYAMDRDKRWERVQLAYEALVDRKGERRHQDPIGAIDEVYAKHVTDEFIQPILFGENNGIEDGDAVIFFNFRADRARELTITLTDPGFQGFRRRIFPKLGMFVCMTEYDKTFNLPVAFPAERPKRVLAELLSERKIPQFHTAETEKYAHVTYFLNGGIEKPFPLEERLLVPSPKDVPTYDKKPEMHAQQVTDEALKRIHADCPVVIMNYANPDMVGHSGDFKATVRAVEVIDDCLGQLAQAVEAKKGTLIITADHGNCEEMIDKKGGPHTAHTTNKVPFILVNDSYKCRGGVTPPLRSGGGLQDVAPTILSLLGISKPPEMTGTSLISS